MTDIQQLIEKNKSIFWDIPDNKLSYLSDKAILERFLNYAGNMETVLKVIYFFGIDKSSQLFFELIKQNRKLINIKTENYFIKYFDKYVK